MRFKLIGRKFIRRSWGSRAVAAGSAFRRCEGEARSEKHKQTRKRERENISLIVNDQVSLKFFFVIRVNWNYQSRNQERKSKRICFQEVAKDRDNNNPLSSILKKKASYYSFVRFFILYFIFSYFVKGKRIQVGTLLNHFREISLFDPVYRRFHDVLLRSIDGRFIKRK